jgi:hypothetical protein
VTGPWPEVGTAGLLWDGARLVAIEPRAADRVEDLIIGRGVPVALELTGLRDTGRRTNGIPIVALGGADSVVIGASAPMAPSADLPRSSDDARWVSLVGRLMPGDTPRLATRGGASVVVDRRCDGDPPLPAATVGIVGYATGDRPGALVAPCGAVRLAPALGRSTVLGAEPVADTGPRSASTRGRAPSGSPTAGLAAGFLSAAALTVLAAVIVARRRGDEPPVGGPGTQEAAGVDTDEHAGPPTLSLVSVPRRAGP